MKNDYTKIIEAIEIQQNMLNKTLWNFAISVSQGTIRNLGTDKFTICNGSTGN